MSLNVQCLYFIGCACYIDLNLIDRYSSAGKRIVEYDSIDTITGRQGPCEYNGHLIDTKGFYGK